MSAVKEEADLSAFLAKVDEIGDLVKDLNTSSDSTAAVKAIDRADEYLLKSSKASDSTTGFNHTSVNTHTSESVATHTETSTTVQQQDFFESMEADASARAERRRIREVVSKEWKRKGAESFKRGHLTEALDCYTEAVKETPWETMVYTNRALCCNKLERYEEAIEDCDTAIRIEPSTVKAHTHKGKALAALGRHKQAVVCYQEALKCDPHNKLKTEIQTELDALLAATQ